MSYVSSICILCENHINIETSSPQSLRSSHDKGWTLHGTKNGAWVAQEQTLWTQPVWKGYSKVIWIKASKALADCGSDEARLFLTATYVLILRISLPEPSKVHVTSGELGLHTPSMDCLSRLIWTDFASHCLAFASSDWSAMRPLSSASFSRFSSFAFKVSSRFKNEVLRSCFPLECTSSSCCVKSFFGDGFLSRAVAVSRSCCIDPDSWLNALLTFFTSWPFETHPPRCTAHSAHKHCVQSMQKSQ